MQEELVPLVSDNCLDTELFTLAEAQTALAQLYPTLSPHECQAWANWTLTQDNYYWVRVGEAVCGVKVYTQIDPPWLTVAQEVAWWGTGRDAVRALHRAMDWARLQGATMFGYSLAPNLGTITWRKL